MEEKKFHFYLIDSFRGIASLWILMLHVLPGYFPNNEWINSFLNFGRIGTDFFFVASGYVSAVACNKIMHSKQDGFALKRIKKIYLLYLCSLILALFVVPILMGLVSFLKSKELVFNFNIPSLEELFFYLTLLKVFTCETWALNRAFVDINGVYWFIAVIVQIYIFIGISLKFKAYFRHIMWATFALSLMSLLPTIKEYIPIGLFIPSFSKFFIGMLLFHAIRKRQLLSYNKATRFIYFVFFSLVTSLVFLSLYELKGDLYRLSSALFIAVLLYLVYPIDKYIKESKAGKITRFLGRISYSTYLTHIIFWPFMYMFVSNLVPLPMYLSAPFVLVPLIIFCSYIFYKCFEEYYLFFYLKNVLNKFGKN